MAFWNRNKNIFISTIDYNKVDEENPFNHKLINVMRIFDNENNRIIKDASIDPFTKKTLNEIYWFSIIIIEYLLQPNKKTLKNICKFYKNVHRANVKIQSAKESILKVLTRFEYYEECQFCVNAFTDILKKL